MSTATVPEPSMRPDDLMTAEEFLDREMGSMIGNGRPSTTYTQPVLPSSPKSPGAPEPGRDARSKVLPRLLAMADSYLRAGSLRQALEMYFDLYRNHRETPEAGKAEDRILEVAAIHEGNGELHLARAIYEQLI